MAMKETSLKNISEEIFKWSKSEAKFQPEKTLHVNNLCVSIAVSQLSWG